MSSQSVVGDLDRLHCQDCNYRTQAKQGRGRDSSSMAGGGMGSQWGASRVDVKGSDSMAGGRMVVGCGAW